MHKNYLIFISHISEEQLLAIELKRALLEVFGNEISIFVSSDRESIPLASNWFEYVNTMLEDTNLMIVISSTESIKRPWIQFESGAAWVRSIPLIPLCHSDMYPEELPPPFVFLETTRMDDLEGFGRLIELIEKHSNKSRLAQDTTIIASKFQQAQIDWNRHVALASLKRSIANALGFAQLCLAPILIDVSYWFVLMKTGSRERAGEWFLMSAFLFVWPFGWWFKSARPDSQRDSSIMAALLIATFTGAGGLLVYRNVSTPNDFPWFFDQKMNMITFYCACLSSFLAGSWLVTNFSFGKIKRSFKR